MASQFETREDVRSAALFYQPVVRDGVRQQLEAYVPFEDQADRFQIGVVFDSSLDGQRYTGYIDLLTHRSHIGPESWNYAYSFAIIDSGYTPFVPAQAIPGDTDFDGDIDTLDVLVASANFTGPGSFGATQSLGDSDEDGDIDDADIALQLSVLTESNDFVGVTPPSESGSASLVYFANSGSVLIDRPNNLLVGYSVLGSGFDGGEHSQLLSTSISTESELSGISDQVAAPAGDLLLGKVLPAGLTEQEWQAHVDSAYYVEERGAGLLRLPLVFIDGSISPADLDLDGDVDDADFAIAFAAFSGPGVPTSNPAADLDGDLDVDDADFGLAFAAYSGPGGSANVPEPGAGVLAVALAGALLGRRRRG